MHVHEIMSTRVDHVAPGEPLVKAAKHMRDDDIGSLPVMENGQLVGMITDRDVVVRAVAEQVDLREARVRDAMSTASLVYCHRDDTVEEASRKMAEARVRRLPVLDENRRVVGIVSLGDLAQHESPVEAGEALRQISKPTKVPWTV